MRVFKFGGASVKSANAINNLVRILEKYKNEELVIVVSAMGKTTNAMENIVDACFFNPDKTQEKIQLVYDYHQSIMEELFPNKESSIYSEIDNHFAEIKEKCSLITTYDYHKAYDQLVVYGELISSSILHAFLNEKGLKNHLLDAGNCIICDNSYREAHINWEITKEKISEAWKESKAKNHSIVLTQGFIGKSAENAYITLGREGSDFSAAIFAYVLDAEEVVVWKDVPGLFNADPKYFPDTIKLDCISYHEAIELAYYGAKVIHPKTIKPLENKKIPLVVRSFQESDLVGSIIQENACYDHKIPSFIIKENQILVSISPKDFSFVAEKNLHDIFGLMTKYSIRSNLMQNSAISFSLCVDNKKHKLDKFIQELKKDFFVKYNEGLELITIRHHNEEVVKKMIANKKLLLEQRSRTTVQLVLKKTN
jgi:aspartate kinase